jgi:endonuclease YncB( thermonuclease family)
MRVLHHIQLLVVGTAACAVLSCSPPIPDDAPDEIEAVRSYGGVVDGDTIRTYSGQLIRLVGIDAPEVSGPYTSLEKGGKEATSFARSFLDGSDVVYLAFDHKRYGDHGRLLAYVYREKDYRMLNRAMVKAGRAEAYHKYSYRRKPEFLQLEEQARSAGQGIWKD